MPHILPMLDMGSGASLHACTLVAALSWPLCNDVGTLASGVFSQWADRSNGEYIVAW